MQIEFFARTAPAKIVVNVVRRGRLRWFGHLELRSVDDRVSACRKVEVEGARCKERNRMTWEE